MDARMHLDLKWFLQDWLPNPSSDLWPSLGGQDCDEKKSDVITLIPKSKPILNEEKISEFRLFELRNFSFGIKLELKDLISVVKKIKWVQHRSRETRINLVFQFAPEKLGRFESKGQNFLVF